MEEGVRYATVDSARVAYQTHGAGEIDIVYSPGLASHLDLTYEQPRYRRYIDALTRYGRVIRFDRRGAGISDPLPAETGESWEMWTEDLAGVLDDVGSRSVAIIATNDAGPAALLFAAVHPQRIHWLVLFNTTARFSAAPDYPQGHAPDTAEHVVAALRQTWGTEASVDFLAPSLAADQPFRRWYSRFQRAACSPAVMADNLARLFRMDARHILPEVQCPTLVLHRQGYAAVGIEHGCYIASRIPGAVFEELPGTDAPIYTEGTPAIIERIGRFLGRAPAPSTSSRTFATVLFTDIVGSTQRAIALGDEGWQSLLEAHDVEVRDAVQAHAGRVIKSTGDGILATFDAPSRAVRCAIAIHHRVGALDIDVRAGLHAGAVAVRDDGDISGVAVNVAARVVGRAGAGEVLASKSVVDLVTDDSIAFDDRGSHELKGIPDPQHLYSASHRGAGRC